MIVTKKPFASTSKQESKAQEQKKKASHDSSDQLESPSVESSYEDGRSEKNDQIVNAEDCNREIPRSSVAGLNKPDVNSDNERMVPDENQLKDKDNEDVSLDMIEIELQEVQTSMQKNASSRHESDSPEQSSTTQIKKNDS